MRYDEKSTGLKFDLTNGRNGLASRSPFVRTRKNGIRIDVPDGVSAKLNFLFVCGETDLPLDIKVNVGKGASLELLELYGSASGGRGAVAPMHTVDAGEGSRSEISILHGENRNAVVNATGRITAREDSEVRFNSVYCGGSATKSTLFADAAGRNGSVSVSEIAVGRAGQEFEMGAVMLNSAKDTDMSLRSGAVLGGGARCVIKGYAKVPKGAAGAGSEVSQRGLLLDSASKAKLMPGMSVECRDVESASHSASVSPIGRDELFYLMSRGMSEARARRALVEGFVSRHIAGMGSDTVKELALSTMLGKQGRE